MAKRCDGDEMGYTAGGWVDKSHISQVAWADCGAEGDVSEDGSKRQTAIYATGELCDI